MLSRNVGSSFFQWVVVFSFLVVIFTKDLVKAFRLYCKGHIKNENCDENIQNYLYSRVFMTYFFVDYLGQIKWREKQQIKRTNETQIWFFEKSNKIDNSPVRLINENKKERRLRLLIPRIKESAH